MRNLVGALACAMLPLALSAQTPDLIIVHGDVFTGPLSPRAEAIAMREGHVIGVGTTAQILSMARANTRAIDAQKHFIVPGFNDAHTHQTPMPERFTLGLNADPTWEDLQLALGSATDETPEGPWIFGTIGPKLLRDARVTAAALDQASRNRKVLLSTFTGHAVILSGAALQALHITGDNVPGGRFERDGSGRPTGKAFEYGAYMVKRNLAGRIADMDAAEQLSAYVNDALHLGVTSIQNMSFYPGLRYDKVLRHNAFPMHIRLIRFPDTTGAFPDLSEIATLPVRDHERPLDTVMGWKWILDGTPVEQGAATRENYPNTQANGHINFTPEELAKLVKAAFESQQQFLFHVSGDRTTAALFEAMRAVAPPEQWRAKRVRIEHGDGLLPDLIPIAKDFGVVVVVNPTHSDAYTLFPKGHYLPLRSLLKAGVPVAIGSDDTPNPFRDIAAAIAHRGESAESISVAEAIDLFTRGSAYAEFAEAEKGSIANGQLADLAILSENIVAAPASRLATTHSILTIVNGTIVYNAGALPIGRADEMRP